MTIAVDMGLKATKTNKQNQLFDSLMVFLKEFCQKKNDFEKNQQKTKMHEKFPRGQRTNSTFIDPELLHLSYQ